MMVLNATISNHVMFPRVTFDHACSCTSRDTPFVKSWPILICAILAFFLLQYLTDTGFSNMLILPPEIFVVDLNMCS
jgi:hypothetical protein